LSTPRLFSVLIAAVGGDGSEVLADWLIGAAAARGIPAQRAKFTPSGAGTGSDAWYIEVYPQRAGSQPPRTPVFAASPAAGEVDLVVATELIEAGRAIRAGFASADRTSVIASTHRIYTLEEKLASVDRRFDRSAIPAALRTQSRAAVLIDMKMLATGARCSIAAIAFGASARALPFDRAACEESIRALDEDVEASLRGFAIGFEQIDHAAPDAIVPRLQLAPGHNGASIQRVANEFPASMAAGLRATVARLVEYQDEAYAGLFLDRLRQVLAVDRESGGEARGYPLASETARLLAPWMSYLDVIRVAQIKTSPSRLARIREEMSAERDDPVDVYDQFTAGAAELDDELPRSVAVWARWLNAGSASRRTTSMTGYLSLRALAACGRWRRKGKRYAREHALIERWLGAVRRIGFAALDLDLALEIARCAELVSGYGKARARGVQALVDILERVIEGGGAELNDAAKLRQAIRRARLRAQGVAVSEETQGAPSQPKVVIKPVVFMKRERKTTAPTPAPKAE
jgi:indolepyruvate ferredoxin oxidoreductase beta subunit